MIMQMNARRWTHMCSDPRKYDEELEVPEAQEIALKT